METAYKFESKHLGQAFMQELEEIGYKTEVYWGFDAIHVSRKAKPKMILADGECLSVHNHQQSCGISYFLLESEWNEALEYAREQFGGGISADKLKKGKWYKSTKDFALARYNGPRCVGFGYIGDWSDNINPEFYRWVEASSEEVKQALIKEAERRGYEHGNFECLLHPPTLKHKIASMQYSYHSDDDALFLCGNCLYKKGKWAKIISNKFFDWDVEKKGNKVIFAPDCEAIGFTKEQLSTISYALTFMDDKSVQEVIDEIDKILK